MSGYGVIYGGSDYGDISVRAHRISWIIHFGPIPTGMHVCHKCDVRHCIRPDHLFLGTDADNSNDKVAKRRQWHPKFKLTADKVKEIRRRAAEGTTQSQLAKEFDISSSGICLIVARKVWKHIE